MLKKLTPQWKNGEKKMSTRSNIAFEYNDGSVVRMYCHWDGYLEHNGRVLRRHYKNKQKVLNLIKLGQIRSLEPSLEEIEAYENAAKEEYFQDWQDASKNMQEYFYLFKESESKWYVLYTHSGSYRKGELIELKEALKNLEESDED